MASCFSTKAAFILPRAAQLRGQASPHISLVCEKSLPSLDHPAVRSGRGKPFFTASPGRPDGWRLELAPKSNTGFIWSYISGVFNPSVCAIQIAPSQTFLPRVALRIHPLSFSSSVGLHPLCVRARSAPRVTVVCESPSSWEVGGFPYLLSSTRTRYRYLLSVKMHN